MTDEVRAGNVADYRVVVDGTDYTPRFRNRLISLTLNEKRAEEADQLDLVLDDADGGFPLPSKGRFVQLQLGWLKGVDVPIGLVDKGSFKIDQVGWGGVPDTVTITARSADLTAAFRTRREAAHRNTTLGAIARTIAGNHGLQARVAPELDGVAVPVLAQHHASDMALLLRLGREHDAVATVKHGTLILAPIGRGLTTSGRTLAAVTIRKSDVERNYRYCDIDRSADAAVEARWHDQDSATRKTVTVGDGSGKTRRLRRVYHTEEAAREAASAAAGRAQRSEASFDLSLSLGRPDLAPEQRVTVAGFKPAIDARNWLIAELEHRFQKSGGLSTRLKLETVLR